ncbi:ATP-binding protein [Desulfobulbus rhabdoformis]|uniref:ATP-binding protein n=1 Tax=Desulfobulbus rhabdoformis TaxID=34032 RepID=UPI0019643B6E|nr:ATP-binding protein [Desulfobulbus rhabdoformis]MBM9614230.1 ATP-binding protein [Desulfobulbus rhabdoformis]
MIISIASGKGGTGKTTVSTNLTLALGDRVELLDCDVEEPNAHLFLKPEIEQTRRVETPVPKVDLEKCTFCKKCQEICRFNALAVVGKQVLVFSELCHSCGGCMLVCPEKAISEVGRELGVLNFGNRDGIRFINGLMRVGEAMSPPLIKQVRANANPDKITLIDAPPGTSCPVIAAMNDTDFVLLVTEPTPFGLHDLKLAVEAVKLLGIPAGLVVNRADLGTDDVYRYAEQENLPILLSIPFDRRIAEAYSRGKLIVEEMPEWREKFVGLFEQIETIVNRSKAQLCANS